MIYIWTRRAPKWEDWEAVQAQLPRQMTSKVELWNDTFNIPFHLFRHRVRQIAELNVSRVERAVSAPWDEIPDGSLVLPVDDDDWFAPHVATVLAAEHEARGTGYYWISRFIELPINFPHRLGLIRRRILPRTPPSRFVFTTNNYALPKEPETKLLLDRHAHASEVVEKGAAGPLKKLEQNLSVMNRTLGSQTSLAYVTRRSQLIWKYHRYKALYRRLEMRELPWCRPYLEMMADLMDELKPKDRPHTSGGLRELLRP
jgi:hypothetical protein